VGKQFLPGRPGTRVALFIALAGSDDEGTSSGGRLVAFALGEGVGDDRLGEAVQQQTLGTGTGETELPENPGRREETRGIRVSQRRGPLLGRRVEEPLDRHRLGREQRAHPDHGQCHGVGLGQPLQGQRDRPGQGHGVPGGPALLQRAQGVVAEHREVQAHGYSSARDEPGRLGEREGEVAEGVGQLVGLLLGHPGLAPQEGDRLGPGEDVDLDGRRHPGPVPVARGDDHVALAAGEPLAEVVGPDGVVEDQQPAGATPEVILDLGRRFRGGRPGRHDGRGHCEGGDLVADELGLLGVDPPDQVVLAGEPVGVLDRQ
jgi:hypothetical protein